MDLAPDPISTLPDDEEMEGNSKIASLQEIEDIEKTEENTFNPPDFVENTFESNQSPKKIEASSEDSSDDSTIQFEPKGKSLKMYPKPANAMANSEVKNSTEPQLISQDSRLEDVDLKGYESLDSQELDHALMDSNEERISKKVMTFEEYVK